MQNMNDSVLFPKTNVIHSMLFLWFYCLMMWPWKFIMDLILKPSVINAQWALWKILVTSIWDHSFPLPGILLFERRESHSVRNSVVQYTWFSRKAFTFEMTMSMSNYFFQRHKYEQIVFKWVSLLSGNESLHSFPWSLEKTLPLNLSRQLLWLDQNGHIDVTNLCVKQLLWLV